jgi:putative transposase
MRKPRYLVHDHFGYGVYHVVSRVTDRRLVLGDEEKDKMVQLMRSYAQFSGITVLTFCIMGNHFHWLIHLPRKPEDAELMPDAELVARIEKCQGLEVAARVEHQLKYMVEKGLAEDRVKLREQWLARMWNLSAFVQSVKQRFTVWFNKKHKRKGTLWEERFKSVVLMGSQATAACAAYIDLNPVRAGIVDDPADYRWSGYGEAVAGVKVAREGLIYALTRLRGPMLPAKSSGVNVLVYNKVTDT